MFEEVLGASNRSCTATCGSKCVVFVVKLVDACTCTVCICRHEGYNIHENNGEPEGLRGLAGVSNDSSEI